MKNKEKNISNDRKKYLKKIKRNKVFIFLMQILILIIFLGIWELFANIGILDSFITSSPSRIVKTFINLSSNNLLKHIFVTSYETIVGFSLGTIIGLVTAILLWWSETLAKIFEPYLVVLNSLPKVALRTYNNYMGWCWNTCYNCYGCCNFTYCCNFRKFKWIFENR